MAKGPDPNRWTPTDPEAAEDEGLGVHEPPTSSGVRRGLVIAVVLLALLVLVLMA
jgi:hypothetical protein